MAISRMMVDRDVRTTGNSAQQHAGKSSPHPPQKCPFSWGNWTHI